MPTRAAGSFDVKTSPLPPEDATGGAAIGRFVLDKQFHGDLEAVSKGQMLGAGNPATGTAGYVAMEHVAKNEPKILSTCKLPLTGKGCVNVIVTDYAYIEVTPQGLVVKELAPGHTFDEVQKLTGAKLTASPELKTMPV